MLRYIPSDNGYYSRFDKSETLNQLYSQLFHLIYPHSKNLRINHVIDEITYPRSI